MRYRFGLEADRFGQLSRAAGIGAKPSPAPAGTTERTD